MAAARGARPRRLVATWVVPRRRGLARPGGHARRARAPRLLLGPSCLLLLLLLLLLPLLLLLRPLLPGGDALRLGACRRRQPWWSRPHLSCR